MSETLNELSAEPRSAARGRTFLAAKISWDDGAFSLDCVMRDLSESGARLRLPASRAVPTSFYLLEVRTGEIWEVQVAWRRYPDIGVTFVRNCRDDPEPSAAVRVLLQLRAEALERSGIARV
jgi:hypothetical protein